MNSWKVIYFLLGLGIGFANTSRAQTIVTDRPDQTESATIVPLGMLQWEGGVLSETGDWTIPNSLFRLPVREDFEFRWVYNRQPSSVDMEVGFKWNVLDGERNGTMLAILSHWAMPTSAEQSDWGSSHKICVSHDVGDQWALGYNLGVQGANSTWDMLYTLAIGRSVWKGWSVYAEPYGTYDLDTGLEARFDAGVTWLQNSRTQWDWSYGWGLNDSYQYQAIGLSWLIGEPTMVAKD